MPRTAHTPQKKDSPVVFKTPLQHYASDPNLTDSPRGNPGLREASSSRSSLASSNKRKRDELTKSDILELFASFRADQDVKFEAILSSIYEVKVSMDFMSQKYDEVLKRVDLLEKEKIAQDSQILLLENKIDTLERLSRGTSIELRNIPQAPKEAREDIKNLVIKTAEQLSITLDSSEIRDVYRVNLKTSKPIIAEFTTVSMRDRFVGSYKKFNREHQTNKFSTTNLSITGPSNPVYISENLTQRDRKLYYLAREFTKSNDYSFCWTSFGRIFVRRSEGSPPIRISCEGDLDNLQNK